LEHALFDVRTDAVSNRWSDFFVRTASAFVLGPIAIFCVWHGGWAWSALLAVAMAGLGWEWGRLAKLKRPTMLAALLLSVWGVTAFIGPLAGLVAILAVGLGTWAFFRRFAAWGVPYAGIGGISLLWLRLRPDVGLTDTLFLVLVVWGTDIGAYLAGRLFGGPKLAPWISPGKTWCGSFGGLLIGALAGEALAAGGQGFSPAGFGAGLLLSLCAQGGDLLESAIKRKLGVKDSGRTIPGHGGLFDRLDGFLAAAPVAALLAFSVHGGTPIWG
jgi:phosphatidate cytidylyltransferase